MRSITRGVSVRAAQRYARHLHVLKMDNLEHDERLCAAEARMSPVPITPPADSPGLSWLSGPTGAGALSAGHGRFGRGTWMSRWRSTTTPCCANARWAEVAASLLYELTKPASTEEERMSSCGWVLRCSWDNGFVRITSEPQGAPIRCYQRATPTG